MARSIEVKILGDAASLHRELAKSSAGLKTFEKDAGRSGRGALAASGAFQSLGRSIAFASASFLGAAGIVSVMKSSITAAEDLRTANERLKTVVDNLGLGFQAHAKQIDKTLTAQERLSAFSKQDLADSLAKLVPATHDVTKGLQDVALASDVARGRHMDLAAATLLVVKAQEGNTGALKRMGIAIDPVKTATNALTDSHKHFTTELKAQAKEMDAHATALKAIAALTKTYGGAAQNATTPSERFHAAIHELQVAIGQGLLPEINKYLPQLTTWVTKTVESGAVHRDMKTAIDALKTALGALKQVLEIARAAFQKLSDATGGSKHALELLAGAYVAFKVAPLVAMIGKIALAWDGVAASADGAAAAQARARGIPFLGKVGLGAAAAAVGGTALRSASPSWADRVVGAFASPLWVTDKLTGRHDFPGFGGSPGSPGMPGSPTSSAAVMAAASGFAGVPYQWGGGHGALAGPSFASGHGRSGIGLDCSGYARAVLSNMGINVSGSAATLLGAAKSHPSLGSLQPGDLVFYEGIHPNHVMVYIGNGQVIGETHTGAAGPEIKSVGYLRVTGTGRYWGSGAASGSGAGPTAPGATPAAAAAASPSLASLLTQGTTKGRTKKLKVPGIVSGDSLFSGALRNKIADAASRASNASSDSIAGIWLQAEADDIVQARDEVSAKLAGAKGKQKQAISAEVQKLTDQLRSVSKAIADNIKSQVDAVKAAFSGRISTAQGNVSTAFGQIRTDLVGAFQAQTQRGIAGIGGQFFQGGMTPAEQRLADMQNAISNRGLQQALAAAQASGDAQQIQQAQEAIDLNNLQMEATKERAQADKDYAAAVQKYTDERALEERKLTDALVKFELLLVAGKAKISDLNAVAQQFGVSLDDIPAGDLSYDMGNLSDSVQTLTGLMNDLADAIGRITGKGSTAGSTGPGSKVVIPVAIGPAQGNPNVPGATSGVIIAGQQMNPLDVGRLFHASGGIATRPTFGVFGESGTEALIPLSDPRAARILGGGDQVTHTHLYLDGKEFFVAVQRQAQRNKMRNGSTGLT